MSKESPNENVFFGIDLTPFLKDKTALEMKPPVPGVPPVPFPWWNGTNKATNVYAFGGSGLE